MCLGRDCSPNGQYAIGIHVYSAKQVEGSRIGGHQGHEETQTSSTRFPAAYTGEVQAAQPCFKSIRDLALARSRIFMPILFVPAQ